MNPSRLQKRVASRFLRAAGGDLQWSADQMDAALQILDDVASVLDLRGPGKPSLSDEFKEAAAASKDIRGSISRSLAKHVTALKRIKKQGGVMGLRQDIQKLATERPELRRHLVPLLRKEGQKWIQKAIKHPGALHKHFGIPEGEKIPTDKIKGELSKLKKKDKLTDKEKTLQKQLNMALTLRGPKVPPPKGKKKK